MLKRPVPIVAAPPQTNRMDKYCVMEVTSKSLPTTKLVEYIKRRVTQNPRIAPNNITAKKTPTREAIVFILCIE